MSAAAKPYTIPLDNVGLDYSRNNLLIPPFGLEDIRNCLLSGGVGKRGGSSILDNISGNPRITGGYDYSLKNGERFLIRSTEDGKIYKDNSNTIMTGLSIRYPESLNETDFATHAKWDVTGDFDDTGGYAAYTHSSGVGTLTQTKANLATKLRANTLYEFTYPVSASSGDAAATIPTTVATVEKTLNISDGTQTIQFFTIANPTDFIINATSTSGGFTLDDVSLKELGGAARSVKFNTYKEKLIYTNGVDLVQTWDGSDTDTHPFGGIRSDDISFSEAGKIVFSANPTANDTITLHDTVFTFIIGASTATDIQIKASLTLTLDEALTVLNGSADTNTAKCTYSKSGATTLIITRDTATDNDPFQIEATITGGVSILGVHKIVNVQFGANPSDGDTFIFPGAFITFKTTVVSPLSQVKIGATRPDTLDNLIAWFADPETGGSSIPSSDSTYAEDGTDTITATAVDSVNGNVYQSGATIVGQQVTVTGVYLYSSITSISLDFFNRGFSESSEIRVFNSSTSDGTYTIAGNTLYTATSILYLAFGTSFTPEAASATTSITYGMPSDWTDGDMPRYSMIYNVGNAKGILFYGVRTNPGRIYIVPDDSFDASDSNVIQLTIETEDGLGIVGAREYGNRQFVFSNDNAWYLDLTSTVTSDWTFVKVPFGAGAMHDRVMVEVGNDLYIMNSDGNVYSVKRVQAFGDYEAGSLTRPSVAHPYDIDRWIKANIDFDYFEDFHAKYDLELDAIFWWVVRIGQTTSDTALVYFVSKDRWVIHDNRDYSSGFSASCSFIYREAGGIKKLYTGDHSGNVWKLNQSSKNDNSNGYYAGFKFNKISYSASKYSEIENKHVDVNYIVQEVLGSHTLNVDTWIDGVASGLNTQTVACDARYKTFDVGAVGRDFQYEISNSNANEDFFLMALVSMIQYNGIAPV
jgi:hypothetical protein